MADPSPRLVAGGPLEVIDARTLFADAPLGRRSAASLVRIESTGPAADVLLARGRGRPAQPGGAGGHPLGRRRRRRGRSRVAVYA